MKYKDKQVEIPGHRKYRGQIIKPGEVEVKLLLKLKTETREAWFELGVRSNVKPECWAWLKTDADQEAAALENEIRYNAETLARYQCINLGDNHNPPAIAKAAVEALKEILRKAELAKQGKKVSGPSTTSLP